MPSSIAKQNARHPDVDLILAMKVSTASDVEVITLTRHGQSRRSLVNHRMTRRQR